MSMVAPLLRGMIRALVKADSAGYNPAFALLTPGPDGVISTSPVKGSATPSFTRDTTATFTDWEGVIRSANSGELRFEGGRRVENLVLQSESLFASSGWTENDSTCTVYEGTCPIGSPVTLTADPGATIPFLRRQDAAHTIGASYVYSAVVKKNVGVDWVFLLSLGRSPTDSSPSPVHYFNLAEGTSATAGGFIEPLGDGWYRISASVESPDWPSSIGVEVRVGMGRDGLQTIPSAVGTESILVSAIQLENVTGQSDTTTPGPYVPTTTAAASRYYSTTPSQRVDTNLLLQSQDISSTWVNGRSSDAQSAGTAPDGTNTANTIIEDTSVTNTHNVYQVFSTLDDSTDYVFSCFFKAKERTWCYLQITDKTNTARYAYMNLENGAAGAISSGLTWGMSEDYGDGWYRLKLGFNTASGAGTPIVVMGPASGDNGRNYTGDGASSILVWGAQLEEVTGIPSTYPSEYIATTTAAVSELHEITQYPLRPVSTVLGIRRFATYAPWEAAETVALGQRRAVTIDGLGYYAVCTVAGTTHATTEPTWVADGVEITDNTAGWTVDDTNLYRLKGPLIEESRTNICLQSEDFATTWAVFAGTLAIVGNEEAAPDGTLTADKVCDNGASGLGVVGVSQAGKTVTVSTAYCLSAYVKAGGVDECRFEFSNNVGINTQYFDLGAVTTGASGANISGKGIEDAGNGWYRCWMTFLSDSSDGSGNIEINVAVGGGVSVPLDGTSSIFVWGAQLEAGSAPSAYIPTTTAPVTRNADALSYDMANWYEASKGAAIFSYEDAANSSTPLGFTPSNNRWASINGNMLRPYDGTNVYNSADPGLVPNAIGAITYGELSSSISVCGTSPTSAAYDGNWDDGTGNLFVGSTASGVNHINGHLLNLVYIPQRISDADLVTLSAREHSND